MGPTSKKKKKRESKGKEDGRDRGGRTTRDKIFYFFFSLFVFLRFTEI